MGKTGPAAGWLRRPGSSASSPSRLSVSCAARQMSISDITASKCTAAVDKGLRLVPPYAMLALSTMLERPLPLIILGGPCLA
jgi:hypothetical protein